MMAKKSNPEQNLRSFTRAISFFPSKHGENVYIVYVDEKKGKRILNQVEGESGK